MSSPGVTVFKSDQFVRQIKQSFLISLFKIIIIFQSDKKFTVYDDLIFMKVSSETQLLN